MKKLVIFAAAIMALQFVTSCDRFGKSSSEGDGCCSEVIDDSLKNDSLLEPIPPVEDNDSDIVAEEKVEEAPAKK